MVDLKKVLYVLFGFITGSMGALSWALPQLGGLSASKRAGLLVGLGVVLSLVIYAMIKLIMSGIVKEFSDQMLAKKRSEDAARRVKYPLAPETRVVEKPPDPKVINAMVAEMATERVAQLLSLFQKKGRLIDFLQEDISAFDDNQVGHAVRSIHKECKEVMAEYLSLEPVMKESEGDDVTVESGFDPSAIRITGNVSGEPPFRGVLRHSGWSLTGTKLPEKSISVRSENMKPENMQSKNKNLNVIEPAEIEIP
ncbi:MAG: DUF2760 domain-containing protein [Nitrospirae bacterium]|nr:DUF2760 domain-containing protein [Nitrospirota bacterium]